MYIIAFEYAYKIKQGIKYSNVYPNKRINGHTFKFICIHFYVTVIRPDFDFSSNDNSDFDTSTGIISTLLTCENVLAEQLSKLPLEVYANSKEKGKIKDKEHALYRLLHSKPNNYQAQTLFFQNLEKYRNHYGNAFTFINRKVGKPDSLELIHPLEIKGYKLRGRNFTSTVWMKTAKNQ